jgi:AraC family transcriptional regulator, regulatory protein of adaptative response / DNA-3-methyladenine glycosylase II
MLLDEETCYRAARSRDARFDGRFFTAVKTTGIYCRPICPARTPLRKNVRFFACAAAAEEAGFRPCRRCRPDAAPGTPAWNGPSATVSRAIRLIERGALDEGSVDDLAVRLGVGGRQLRRLFAEHLGTSPLLVARSRRAHFARALLDATAWPMARVAEEAGFHSVRRFNEVVQAVFQRTPSELRRRGGPDGAAVTLRLAYRPPYDWPALVAFLGVRAIPGVEVVDAAGYRRTVESGRIEVRPDPRRNALALTLTPLRREHAQALQVAGRVRRMFDLDADPLQIAAVLSADPRLGPSVRARPGLRIPGAWDPFESSVRAILGQQVSVRAATTFAGRLVEAFGSRSPAPAEGLTHLFPAPEQLASAPLERIGLTRARAASIRSVARSAQMLRDRPESLEGLVDRLCTLPGVGPWTANYLAMRAFGEADAFPAGDLGLRKASGDPSTAELERRSAAWRPWRAYAAMHLWSSLSPEPKNDRAVAG